MGSAPPFYRVGSGGVWAWRRGFGRGLRRLGLLLHSSTSIHKVWGCSLLWLGSTSELHDVAEWWGRFCRPRCVQQRFAVAMGVPEQKHVDISSI